MSLQKMTISSVFAIALITLGSSPSQACVALSNPIPKLEEAKKNLSEGNYDEALRFLVGPGASDAVIAETREQLLSTYPTGFDRCETVISDARSPKFRQELVLLGATGESLLFLVWDVVNFDGTWSVLNFNLTTQVAEAMETMK